MTPLLVGILAPTATIIVALVGYFGFKALRAAQTRKTDADAGLAEATADKTAAEAWTLLTGGLTQRMAALDLECASLRLENAELRKAVAHAEEESRLCRLEVGDLKRELELSRDKPKGDNP